MLNLTTEFKDFTLATLVDKFIQVIGGALIPLAITILFLVFAYIVVQFIWKSGDSTNIIDDARSHLFYPVLAIASLFLLWGIIFMIRILFSGL